jgi:LysR family glycine cleavage system transcriptional activator
LLPRLGDFFIRHPDIDVEVAATQAVVDLKAAGSHLGIRYGDGHWPGVGSQLLFEECLFPVASPAYIREHRLRSVRDLRRATLLRDDFHPWQAWLDQAALDPPECAFGAVYRDSALVLQAAESGQGVALGRSWLVADALKAGSLRRIGTLSVPAAASYYLVVPQEGPGKPEVSDFHAWLRSQEAPPLY